MRRTRAKDVSGIPLFEPLESRLLLDGGGAADSFTLVILPDTQMYSLNQLPQFHQQTQWIAEHAASDNLAFVSQVGDVVQNGALVEDEWIFADAALDALDGAVPYSIAIGNHDFDVIRTHSSVDMFRQYISDRYSGSWFLGASEDSLNYHQLFTACGQTYHHIALEWEPRDSSLACAQAWIDELPGVPVILTTHSYLAGSTRTTSALTPDGNSGEQIFQKLVRSNPEIFLILCGHLSSEVHRVVYNDAGLEVIEIMANYQGRANGGDGWMQLLEFQPEQGQIQATTYSPSLDCFETDSNSQYTIALDFDQRFGFAIAPTAADDEYATDEDAPVVADVLANDTDPNGQPLVVGSFTQGDHGTIVLNPDQTLTYTPQADFAGTDSFTYRAFDGELYSDAVTVTITVQPLPDAPTGEAQTFTVDENSASGTFVGQVVASDADAGDTLTYRLVSGNVNYAFVIHGATGRILVDNPLALDYETTPTFHLTVEVTDSTGLSCLIDVTIDLNDLLEAPSRRPPRTSPSR